MKRNILTLALFVGLSGMSLSQSGKLKKADNYYSQVSYMDAALLYTDLLGSEVDSPELKSKLADCYYQMGETAKAEEYYAMVVSTPEATNSDLYQYAQSLKENGKYSESDQWMDKFNAKAAGDSRGMEFSKNKNYISAIEKQGAFFDVKHLSINTSGADFGGYPMSGDSKEIFIVSNRKKRVSVQRFHSWNDKSFLDLYSTEQAEDGSLSNADMQPRKTNSKYHEGPMCFTPDGKMVYFTRNNISKGKNKRDGAGIQNLKIYRAQIGEDGKWLNEESISLNSKDYSVGHPSFSADGKTMYFASDMPGGSGGADIYKVSVSSDGTLGKPENLGSEVNTEGQEMFPWLTDEGVLFFASDGHVGLGGLDVYAMIPDNSGAFKKRMNVGKPVNSSRDDFGLVMYSERSGYVSSNREGGTGDDDIYGVTLLKALKINLSVNGVVSEIGSGAILPGATVNLVDASGNVISSTTADDKGAYNFDLEPDLDYTITAEKDDYFGNQGDLSTKNLPAGTEELNKDLGLEKDPGLALHTLITDSKTNEPLEGVSLKIIDNMTGEVFADLVTDETGDYLKGLAGKRVEDRLSYNIELNKEGYFPKTVTFNHKIEQPGVIDVHKALAGALSLDKEVTDLAELIEISPINFDLNKYKIRPDAAAELDKIVSVMNKYPNMEVELGSHTDCRGSKAYNTRLSDKRAKASAAYIKSKITNPERIYGKGYGETRLLNGCACEGAVKSDCSEEEHEKNRRTEFKVISIGADNVKVKNNSTDSFDK